MLATVSNGWAPDLLIGVCFHDRALSIAIEGRPTQWKTLRQARFPEVSVAFACKLSVVMTRGAAK